MKTTNRTLRLMAAMMIFLGAQSFIAPAQAITVSISLATQNINVGDTTSIDIIVSGLSDPVGGFSLTLSFDDILLSGVDFTNDPDIKMGALPLDLSLGFFGDSLDLYFVADALETEGSLGASQGASFTLARVSFKGLAEGLSLLTLADVILSNWDGTETLAPVTTENGEICVGANGCARVVPEPGTLACLGLGILGLSLARRRRHDA